MTSKNLAKSETESDELERAKALLDSLAAAPEVFVDAGAAANVDLREQLKSLTKTIFDLGALRHLVGQVFFRFVAC